MYNGEGFEFWLNEGFRPTVCLKSQKKNSWSLLTFKPLAESGGP